MAENLLNKVINKEIKLDAFIKWLLGHENMDEDYTKETSLNITHIDFLTYFLNFVHENVSCIKSNDTSQKFNKKSEIVEEKIVKSTSKNIFHSSTSEALDNSFRNLSLVSTNSCLTSTPRHKKSFTNVDSSRELSFNPISPIHKSHENSFNASENNKYRNGHKFEPHTTICLGDFIVNRKSSVKKKNKSLDSICLESAQTRRINPTNLTQRKTNNLHFKKSRNSFNFQTDIQEVPTVNVSEHRSFLVEEKKKMLEHNDKVTNDILVKKIIPQSNVSQIKEQQADIQKVVNVAHLDRFIQIYTTILNANMVLNITNEIYFLISLLFSSQNINESNNDQASSSFNASCQRIDENQSCDNSRLSYYTKVNCYELFNSIHNVVYFSVRSLESQIDILKFYDKVTLKLLSETSQLLSFSPNLVQKLKTVVNNKNEKFADTKEDSMMETSVCFNVDTDNSKNFVDSQSFHAFRKQRDLFYDIIRIWEANHLVSGWEFNTNLGGKIHTLFSYSSEPNNFMHFGRLFKSQLLSTCKNIQKEEGLCKDQLPFLSSLPNIDAEKLNRLKSRLVTKQQSNGINSVPEFHGHQEFYKNFILTASNYTFNKHLSDCLIYEILELNDSKVFTADIEENETEMDTNCKTLYLCSIKSLRVLAKFLGFLESLPYKSECTNLSFSLLAAHIQSRQHVNPSFDVKDLIIRARYQNSLILVIPWVTIYLSMLDFVTLRLPYYISVHKILFEIYKECNKSHVSPYNNALLTFSLGWLFELPHFPDIEYFKFCTNFNAKENLKVLENGISTISSNKVDTLDIIDQRILYVCCPFLEEIKKVLTSTASQKRVPAKHITPVTAALPSKDLANKKIQQQLEDSFLNGQPASLKKTLDFVGERVASSIVKHICNVMVPACKNKAIKELKEFLNTLEYNPLNEDRQLKVLIRSEASKLAQTNLENLKTQCEKIISQKRLEQTKQSIEGLLSFDVSPQVKEAAVKIAMKYCNDRIKQWMDTNIIIGIFNKELEGEILKFFNNSLDKKTTISKENKLLFSLPSAGKNSTHNELALSGFHILDKIRICCCELLENKSVATDDSVKELLKQTKMSLTQRNDVNECISAVICNTILEYGLLLVTHKPHIIANDLILKEFLSVVQCYPNEKSELFKHFLSSRNVMMLSQSSSVSESWKVLAKFANFFIKSEVLSIEDFESQCTGLFQNDWDQNTLRDITAFLKNILNYYECNKKNNINSEKFTMLLEFLSDFCHDL